MSGIYIKGMKMPTSCLDCGLCYNAVYCKELRVRFLDREDFEPGERRLPDCPLVPIPDHGRLIDADAVTSAAMEDILGWEDAGCDRDDYRAFLANYIEDASTIIPADKEDKDG